MRERVVAPDGREEDQPVSFRGRGERGGVARAGGRARPRDLRPQDALRPVPGLFRGLRGEAERAREEARVHDLRGSQVRGHREHGGWPVRVGRAQDRGLVAHHQRAHRARVGHNRRAQVRGAPQGTRPAAPRRDVQQGHDGEWSLHGGGGGDGGGASGLRDGLHQHQPRGVEGAGERGAGADDPGRAAGRRRRRHGAAVQHAGPRHPRVRLGRHHRRPRHLQGGGPARRR